VGYPYVGATVTSVLNPLLTAGDAYFFILTPEGSGVLDWEGNDEGVTGGGEFPYSGVWL
jgi:hypothetical protein